MSERRRDRPDRLRQLGRLGILERAGHRGLRHLLRPARARGRHCRRQPRPLHRPRRRRRSDLLFQTSDTTWQAYNRYGGNSLYTGSPAGRRLQGQLQPAVHHARVRRRGLGLQRRVPDGPLAGAQRLRRLVLHGRRQRPSRRRDPRAQGLPVGRPRRVLVGRPARERRGGARRRSEPGVLQRERGLLEDALGERDRTLVSYKETHANAKIDPTPVWTGTWRDPRFSPPADGGRPENALTGTIFSVNSGTRALQVPAAEGRLRLWRNAACRRPRRRHWRPTRSATSGTRTSTTARGRRGSCACPPRRLPAWRSCSTSARPTVPAPPRIDSRCTATRTAAVRTRSCSAPARCSGPGASTASMTAADPPRASAMQQATVNLFADMLVQPATLQAGLTPAGASTDTTPPTSAPNTPTRIVTAGTPVTVSGTAADTGGGRVGGVEVSVDGGATWHPATGLESWSYTWTPTVERPGHGPQSRCRRQREPRGPGRRWLLGRCRARRARRRPAGRRRPPQGRERRPRTSGAAGAGAPAPRARLATGSGQVARELSGRRSGSAASTCGCVVAGDHRGAQAARGGGRQDPRGIPAPDAERPAPPAALGLAERRRPGRRPRPGSEPRHDQHPHSGPGAQEGMR